MTFLSLAKLAGRCNGPALFSLCAACLSLAAASPAADIVPTRQAVGNFRNLYGWQGLTAAAGQGPGGEAAASLSIPGAAAFTYPAGTNGWHWRGFRVEHDGTRDWRDFHGLQLEVKLDSDRPVELTALVKLPPQPARVDFVPQSKVTVVVTGAGWHTVTLPWNAFDFQQAQPSFLKFINELHLSARFTGGDDYRSRMGSFRPAAGGGAAKILPKAPTVQNGADSRFVRLKRGRQQRDVRRQIDNRPGVQVGTRPALQTPANVRRERVVSSS